MLRVALIRFRNIEALFFDFSSLYQAPRTPEQEAIFVRATLAMLSPPYAIAPGNHPMRSHLQ